ncbi:MAG: hypothetical protein PHW76_09100 [Alphaproteobacteria bacterium]|nr:hypothetical protein [Alphaproteobacteria bacterium]
MDIFDTLDLYARSERKKESFPVSEVSEGGKLDIELKNALLVFHMRRSDDKISVHFFADNKEYLDRCVTFQRKGKLFITNRSGKENSEGDGAPTYSTSVIIELPAGLDLKAKLTNCGVAAQMEEPGGGFLPDSEKMELVYSFREAALILRRSWGAVNAEGFVIYITDTPEGKNFFAGISGGPLAVTAKDAKVEVSGPSSSVKAKLFGVTELVTNGNVAGDYKVRIGSEGTRKPVPVDEATPTTGTETDQSGFVLMGNPEDGGNGLEINSPVEAPSTFVHRGAVGGRVFVPDGSSISRLELG